MDNLVPFPTSDLRPQKGGWAPGNYSNTCGACSKHFLGDKRAVYCADCAYDEAPPPTVLPDDMTIGQYMADRLNRVPAAALTPTKHYNIKQALVEGNDPFLLAVHYNVAFEAVAKLAEEHLVSLLGACPQPEPDLTLPADAKIPVVTYIPHVMQDYLFFAAALETDAQKAEAKELGFAGRALRALKKFGDALKEGSKNL